MGVVTLMALEPAMAKSRWNWNRTADTAKRGAWLRTLPAMPKSAIRPPTGKQLAYAKALAAESGRTPPIGWDTNRRICSAFIAAVKMAQDDQAIHEFLSRPVIRLPTRRARGLRW